VPGYFPTRSQRPGTPYYNPARVQYTTCPNSAELRRRVLARVDAALRDGAGGFFIDNGYFDDLGARTACESTTHAHVYGELTGAASFLGLLTELVAHAKRHDARAVVLVNEGVPDETRFYGASIDDLADGIVWESYLFTTYVPRERHASQWDEVYRASVERERAQPRRRTYVLSYPWDRDEAFFAFATAKLCALPFAASLGRQGWAGVTPAFVELTRTRLGGVADAREVGGTRAGELYTRRYQHGMVLVNPTAAAQETTVAGPDGRYRELFTGASGTSARITVCLPPRSGRVLQWER
jgi:hypothetical protein